MVGLKMTPLKGGVYHCKPCHRICVSTHPTIRYHVQILSHGHSFVGVFNNRITSSSFHFRRTLPPGKGTWNGQWEVRPISHSFSLPSRILDLHSYSHWTCQFQYLHTLTLYNREGEIRSIKSNILIIYYYGHPPTHTSKYNTAQQQEEDQQ